MPEPPITAESQPPLPNRLSIGHLLAWLSLTAVEFTVHSKDLSNAEPYLALVTEFSGPEAASATQVLLRLGIVLNWCVLLFSALGLVGLLLWPWRAWTAPGSFPRQPGHWLLIAVGAAASLDMLATLFFHNMVEVEWLSIVAFSFIYHVMLGLSALVPALLLLIALWKRAEGRQWTICFGLFSMGLIVRSSADFVTALAVSRLFYISQWLVLLGGAMVLLSLVLTGIACIIDQRRSVPRDLFHGLGVIAATAVIFSRLIVWAIHSSLS